MNTIFKRSEIPNVNGLCINLDKIINNYETINNYDRLVDENKILKKTLLFVLFPSIPTDILNIVYLYL